MNAFRSGEHVQFISGPNAKPEDGGMFVQYKKDDMQTVIVVLRSGEVVERPVDTVYKLHPDSPLALWLNTLLSVVVGRGYAELHPDSPLALWLNSIIHSGGNAPDDSA